MPTTFQLDPHDRAIILRLHSPDGTNLLTRACVLALTEEITRLAATPRPLILAGGKNFFSAGADLHEVAALTAPEALAFARTGQSLMNAIARFPAPVCAAVAGYCLGGGLDLALAAHSRIAAPNAIFGHRGAALGLITGWGGTQRLPRLIGRAHALQMLVGAETKNATQAVSIGLADRLADDPVAGALELFGSTQPAGPPSRFV